MPTYQVVVGDPETGDSHRITVEDQAANRFAGREIGDEVDGAAVGLDGYTLEITGGSDAAGRPMREDVAGPGLQDVLLEGRTAGYRPSRDGERKRVSVRGREISEAVMQLNTAVVERGEDAIGDLIGEADADDE